MVSPPKLSPAKRLMARKDGLEVTPKKSPKLDASMRLDERRKSPRKSVSRQLFGGSENQPPSEIRLLPPDTIEAFTSSPTTSSTTTTTSSLNRSSSGSTRKIDFGEWDDTLNLYFSPKKKGGSLKGSPSRANNAKQYIDFEEEDSEEGDDEIPIDRETIVMKKNLLDIKNCFQKIDKFLPEQIKSKIEEQKKNFSFWTNMLLTKQFNILIYGVGSKQEILRDYINMELSRSYYIVFDGYEKIVNARSILETLNNEFSLEVAHRGLSLALWAGKIAKAIENQSIQLFIAIHNIDGPGLREQQHQRALSILAKSQSISMIATVDHFNATLLWDTESRNNFQWLFFACSTMKCYGKEIFAGDSKILALGSKQSEKLHTFSSLQLFWEATTANSHKILQQLALHCPNKNSELMLPDFCKILKSEFATTNETVLRQQLVEFCDHNLINLGRDGSIKLCVDQNLLTQFLEKKILCKN